MKARKSHILSFVAKYVVLTICCLGYACGIALFIDPNGLAPGGVTGIAVIFNRITGIPTGTLILAINIPIMLLGIWKFGLKFIASTFYCIALSSFFTNLLTRTGAVTEDCFVAALAGSCLMAVSIGCIFKAGATTGGTDIIIKVLRLRIPHLKTGALFLLMDACVVGLSALVMRDVERAVYSGFTVFLTSVVLDFVLYGKDEAKLIYIISDNGEKIAKRLLGELKIGVTYLHANGAYSNKEKRVLFCAVKKQNAPKTEQVVKEEDPDAFMIVTSATEIYGQGHKSYFTEKI